MSPTTRKDQVRAELAADDRDEGIGLGVGTDDRDLAHRRQIEVDGAQQVPERVRMADRERIQQAQHAERVALVPALARQQREPQQSERGGRVARRDRGVLEVLAPRRQLLVIVGRREEAAALGV